MFCTSVCAEACDSKLAMAILLSEKVSCGRPRAMYSWAFHIAVPLRPCSSSSVDFLLSLNSATCSFSMRLRRASMRCRAANSGSVPDPDPPPLLIHFRSSTPECDDGAVAGSQRGDLGGQLDCTSNLRPDARQIRSRKTELAPVRLSGQNLVAVVAGEQIN